jgi:hypothetical protein
VPELRQRACGAFVVGGGEVVEHRNEDECARRRTGRVASQRRSQPGSER